MSGPPADDRLRIGLLERHDAGALARLADGYVSHERYDVCRRNNDQGATFTIELRALETPFRKVWPADAETDALYDAVVRRDGASFGCFDTDGKIVAIAICERRTWNASLWVWEFHIAPTNRRQGIGRRMMEAVMKRATEFGLASVVCETQNTNVPAIRFYEACGFELDGLDLALYAPGLDEVAFFMRRRLNIDARTELRGVNPT